MAHPDLITPTIVWRTRPRRRHLEVALDDLRARLAGYCNALANDGNLDLPQPGYRHWRCRRRRGHTGQHRSINYVWPVPAGSSGYAPLDTAEQRAAELTLGSVDVDPLPVDTRGRRSPFHDTYAQQWRHLLWRRRNAARRGWVRPTLGQVLDLLRHPGAAIAGLSRARMLEETVGRVVDAGALDDNTFAILGHQRTELAEQLDRAGATR